MKFFCCLKILPFKVCLRNGSLCQTFVVQYCVDNLHIRETYWQFVRTCHIVKKMLLNMLHNLIILYIGKLLSWFLDYFMGVKRMNRWKFFVNLLFHAGVWTGSGILFPWHDCWTHQVGLSRGENTFWVWIWFSTKQQVSALFWLFSVWSSASAKNKDLCTVVEVVDVAMLCICLGWRRHWIA